MVLLLCYVLFLVEAVFDFILRDCGDKYYRRGSFVTPFVLLHIVIFAGIGALSAFNGSVSHFRYIL